MEWRYIKTNNPKVKHALEKAYYIRSICGFSTNMWYGTGSQEEYETNERLPKCHNCLRILGESWQPDLRYTQDQ